MRNEKKRSHYFIQNASNLIAGTVCKEAGRLLPLERERDGKKKKIGLTMVQT